MLIFLIAILLALAGFALDNLSRKLAGMWQSLCLLAAGLCYMLAIALCVIAVCMRSFT